MSLFHWDKILYQESEPLGKIPNNFLPLGVFVKNFERHLSDYPIFKIRFMVASLSVNLHNKQIFVFYEIRIEILLNLQGNPTTLETVSFQNCPKLCIEDFTLEMLRKFSPPDSNFAIEVTRVVSPEAITKSTLTGDHRTFRSNGRSRCRNNNLSPHFKGKF